MRPWKVAVPAPDPHAAAAALRQRHIPPSVVGGVHTARGAGAGVSGPNSTYPPCISRPMPVMGSGSRGSLRNACAVRPLLIEWRRETCTVALSQQDCEAEGSRPGRCRVQVATVAPSSVSARPRAGTGYHSANTQIGERQKQGQRSDQRHQTEHGLSGLTDDHCGIHQPDQRNQRVPTTPENRRQHDCPVLGRLKRCALSTGIDRAHVCTRLPDRARRAALNAASFTRTTYSQQRE